MGVVPAAMPSVPMLTEGFCAAHPAARVEIRSMTFDAIQLGLDTFELDAGLTYLENEPLTRTRSVPLYRERYVLVTGDAARFGGRGTITWKEAVDERLCLLGEDMQNRRILDKVAASAAVTIRPTIVGDSYLRLLSHVRRGGWSTIVPHTFRGHLGPGGDLLALDLVEPSHSEAIGLVLSDRDPPSPMAKALSASVVGADLATAMETALRT